MNLGMNGLSKYIEPDSIQIKIYCYRKPSNPLDHIEGNPKEESGLGI
jgi:hypothetical protein